MVLRGVDGRFLRGVPSTSLPARTDLILDGVLKEFSDSEDSRSLLFALFLCCFNLIFSCLAVELEEAVERSNSLCSSASEISAPVG